MRFLVDRDDYRNGNAGQAGVVAAVVWIESKRDEGGLWRDDF